MFQLHHRQCVLSPHIRHHKNAPVYQGHCSVKFARQFLCLFYFFWNTLLHVHELHGFAIRSVLQNLLLIAHHHLIPYHAICDLYDIIVHHNEDDEQWHKKCQPLLLNQHHHLPPTIMSYRVKYIIQQIKNARLWQSYFLQYHYISQLLMEVEFYVLYFAFSSLVLLSVTV